MIITNAKYNKDQENINCSINCVINGQAMSVPLDPATDTTKQSLNG